MPEHSAEALQRFTAWLEAIGRRVADRRRILGLTQPQAAERCQLDLKFYQDVEYGRRPISTRTLFFLAGNLGVEPCELVPPVPSDGVAPPPQAPAGPIAAPRKADPRGYTPVESRPRKVQHASDSVVPPPTSRTTTKGTSPTAATKRRRRKPKRSE